MPEDRIELFADFTLDLARGCLLSRDQPVHLRPQAYELLKYLAENRGRLISKDRLIETIWHKRAVTDDALVQCLIEVRHALGIEGKQYLRNVRGRGYIFDAEVARNACASTMPAEVVRSGANQPKTVVQATPGVGNIFKHHKRSALLLSLSCVLFAGLSAAYFKYAGSRSREITSIAVLPFTNESGDQNLEEVADGLSESLIDRLSELPDLKVIARTSSFKYKGKEIDPQEIGRALGVQALVIGSVTQDAKDLKISADFVNARDGTQLWGKQFNSGANDLQMIQEEIVRTISQKLSLRLSGTQEQRLTKRATQDSQAYQSYLSGVFFLRRGGFENGRKALDYFTQALALDPNFGLAWAAEAQTYIFFSHDSYLDPKEELAKAKIATQKALDLDETLAQAHLVLAEIRKEEWDWSRADREFKRAIELSPSLVEAHSWYSRFLSPMGRHTEALAEVKRAQELDPLRPGLVFAEGRILLQARRYDEAFETTQEAMKMEPKSERDYFTLGQVYQSKGAYDQAIQEYQRGLSNGDPKWSQIVLGYSLAKSGKRTEAQHILIQLTNSNEYVSPAELAILYVGLGDTAGALTSLEKAYAAHDLQLQYLKVTPEYDVLRSNPRFQELMQRVGFAS